ncbi:DNA polymerase delta catalytic subunit [Orpheovirus IHUMI-LCC2]|uniref:DNA polymerase n=1 Tax=Orpheovirus IHUMI-LCC2 TaxID=2023057 RepID=A0A2I2L4J0_9VIRU|nr:DNA polymerase delta catalytic subunit [Orpheovirus IHUMI-LCC2]SNW62462.1 DNA polymerase delta catalytic subunit [Orpheovirus IHUMI-LCC2]
MAEQITCHAYEWKVEDKDLRSLDGCTTINAWCLDRESKPYLVRFMQAPVYCYIEMPQVVNQRKKTWLEHDVDEFMGVLKSRLRGYSKDSEDHSPIQYQLEHKKKVYYYQGNKKYPMVKTVFKSLEAMRHCENILRKGLDMKDGRFIHCSVWESNISPSWKMLTMTNCAYSQWFTVDAHRVPVAEKVSTLENEFIVYDWTKLRALPPEQTSGWVTNPAVVVFDIETYSPNHKAMPRRNLAKHVAYTISCIYQKYGKPETRKRYNIIFGECQEVKDGEIIRVNTEIELINKFCEVIKQLDPDIISGYNILGFDWGYLDARLKRVGIKEWPCFGRIKNRHPSFTEFSWESSGYGFNTIGIMNNLDGRMNIDMLPIVRRDYKLPKYDLDTVSKKFIKRGKHPVKAAEMFRIFERQESAIKAFKNKIYDIGKDVNHGDTIRKVLNKYIDVNSYASGTINIPIDKVSDIKTSIEKSGGDLYNLMKDDIKELEEAIADMTRVVEYCIEDSELVLDLMQKLNVWISLIEMSNIVCVPVFDIFTRGQQIRVLHQVYKLTSKKGIVIDRRDINKIPYKGAYVVDPIPGLYKNVICLDFASLYPSIMRAYNICYTTLVPMENTDVPDEMCHIFEWEEEIDESKIKKASGTANDDDFDVGDDEEDDDEEDDDELESSKQTKKKVTTKIIKYRFRFIKAPIPEGNNNENKQYHEKGQQGILPELLTNLVNERNKAKKEMAKYAEGTVEHIVLDKRQNALKVSANSMYGALGAQEGGKMPLPEGAMCVTFKGRELIGSVGSYLVKKYNAKIIYGDTDSCMIDVGIIDKKDCNEAGFKLAKEVSEYINMNPVKLEFEKAMYVFLVFKKKKYAAVLIDKHGEPMWGRNDRLTKGIILARRDNCQFLRDIYVECLDVILMEKPIWDTMDIIVDKIEKLVNGEIDWGDLTIIRGIGANYKSDNYFMKVFSDELARSGKPANPGDRIPYIIVKHRNGDIEESTGKEFPLGKRMRSDEQYLEALADGNAEQIDYIYYISKLLVNPIEQLFHVGYKKHVDHMVNSGLGYKPFNNHCRFIPVDRPIKMITKMMEEKRVDFRIMKTAIRQWATQFPVPTATAA